MQSLEDMALGGHGIAFIPYPPIPGETQTPRVLVLPDLVTRDIPMWIVVPRDSSNRAAVRVLVEQILKVADSLETGS